MVDMSVSGAISGIDTASLVSQLMQAEAAPQNQLKARVTNEQSVISAYQLVNTRFAAIGVAAATAAKPETWQSVSVSSSSSKVTVVPGSAAVTGSVSFDVTALATNHQLRSDEITGSGTTIASAGSISITPIGKDPIRVDLTDTTLNGVVTAINSRSDLGVKASAVQVRDGVYRLQLSGSSTGKNSEFSVTGLDVGTAVLAQGTDAAIRVGTGDSAYPVTSPSNTFTGVLPGATFTVSGLESGVTVSSRRDSEGLADKMQAMVNAANAALTEIDRQGSIDANGKATGPLAGDHTLRMLDDSVASTVNIAFDNGVSASTVGVQLDRTGKLTFDRAKFLDALQNSPDATQQTAQALATRMNDLVKATTDSTVGSVTTAITSHTGTVKDLTARIGDWDIRLASRKDMLTRQFTAMEVALGKLKDQASWLSGQIAGLPSGSLK